jgi:hypothetical protein
MNNAASIEQKYCELQAQYDRLLEQKALEQNQFQSQVKQHQSQTQQQQSTKETYKTEIAYLQERLSILLCKRYQAQSEQLKYIQGQLFDEAELEREIAETRQALDELQNKSTRSTGQEAPKQKPKRKPLPDHLRRVEVTVDVSDEDKQAMGDEWSCIGYESSEQLAVVQREYYVKVIKRMLFDRFLFVK